MSFSELMISALVLVSAVLFIFFIFKAKVDIDNKENNIYSVNSLSQELKRTINEIINMDISHLNLNKKDYESRRALKRSLSEAVRRCSQGDMNEKMIVISRIKNTLAVTFGITEDKADEVIPFNHPEKLTSLDKFEIMMYLQKRAGSYHMFRDICSTAGLDTLKMDAEGYYYCITEEDINKAYDKISQILSYDDKLNILTQRIYEETYGLSIVDLLIMEDLSVDSVSGGVSGITIENYYYMDEDLYKGNYQKSQTHESVWIVYSGKSIHMKFIAIKSSAELIRVCKNLSEHGRSGHLTSSEGGLKTHLADGSRVTVFRPGSSTQWAFFVRKFSSSAAYELKDLITDKGCEYPIGVIKWAVHGCLNIIFSGDQNSGKTTNTRAAVREIDRRQPIRTLEADFELYLNDAYYNKNILGTRPSERMSFSKVIELLKSSEAHTILFGETASLEHAKYLIDLLLAGTKRIITTGHWSTSRDLVSYFVHALGAYGSSGTEEVEALVSRLLHLDIHCSKDNDGHRYIDRITEIISYSAEEKEPKVNNSPGNSQEAIIHYLKLLTRKKTYETRDIVVYEHGEYHMRNPFSKEHAAMILRNIAPEERALFLEFNTLPEGRVNEA